MVEGGPKVEFGIGRVKKFARVLAGWDRRIAEIIAIGGLAADKLHEDNKIELVCRFDPEPRDDHHGYFSSFNLLFRDDHECASDKLGITNPINIGFILNDGVYLPKGEVLNMPKDHKVLWSKNNEGGTDIKNNQCNNIGGNHFRVALGRIYGRVLEIQPQAITGADGRRDL